MTNNILFAAGRESSYIRNHLILQAARSISSVTAIAPSQPGSLTRNIFSVLLRLLPALRMPHDLVILGFYAHPLVPLVRRLTAAPILFDAFVSTWDTLCFDRGKFPPNSFRGRRARQLDTLACHSADRVILDTRTHAQYFSDTFGIPSVKINHWYVGCDETIFQPVTYTPRSTVEPMTVFFYGTYQPLHGVDVIVESAALLKDEPNIRFVLIGDGQTFEQSCQIAMKHGLTNIAFHAAAPIATLAGWIASSDICLAGPFGATPKAKRVISGKTAQFLATARPVIAGDSPANRELLVHGVSAYLCQQADPRALAEAIRQLAFDPTLRARIASGGRRLFEERLSLSRLTADLALIIKSALQANAHRAASNRSTHERH